MKDSFNGNKIQAVIMAFLFLAIIFFLGIASDYKLLDYYINDVVYNEYWNPELGRKNETEYSTVFFGKRAFIDINGGIRRFLGQRLMNNVCKLENGQLTALMNPIDDEILIQEAENICDLYSYCRDSNIPFLYIAAPDKISPYDSFLPTGCDDYSNYNTDRFLRCLDESGVPYIDIRHELRKDNRDHYSVFFRTDHHWNAEGGYYTFQKITEWFDANKIAYDTVAADISNYRRVEYNNKLLGSWGQRTGRLFAGSDDFGVFYPDFDTLVTTEGKTGSYRDILLDEDVLSVSGPGFIYDGFYPNTRDVRNGLCRNNTTIMLIGDSFSRQVNPFIILSTQNFLYRKTTSSAELTKEDIISSHPDAVILMQSPWNNLGNEECFSYFKQKK